MIFVDYIQLDQHRFRVEAEVPPGEGAILNKVFQVRGRRERRLNLEKMRCTTLELIRVIVDDDASR